MKQRTWTDRYLRRMAPAWFALFLALIPTLLAWWRVREHIADANQQRFEDEVHAVSDVFDFYLNGRFEPFRETINANFTNATVTPSEWMAATRTNEWRSQIAGLLQIGWVEPVSDGSGQRQYIVRHLDGKMVKPVVADGKDIGKNPVLRTALEAAEAEGRTANTPLMELREPGATNQLEGIVAFMPLMRTNHPTAGRPAEKHASGFLAMTIYPPWRFNSMQSSLRHRGVEVTPLPFTGQVSAEGNRERIITVQSLSGTWRYRVTALPSLVHNSEQHVPTVVLVSGFGVSALLFCVVWVQTRRRIEAEAAQEETRLRDEQIVALNRDLEARIQERTAELEALTMRDMLERQRAEQELQNALAEEKELSGLKSHFISMVSHEIRTPLALILSSAEILDHYLDRLPSDKRRQHLRTIGESVRQLSDLMDVVLLYSRAEAGRIEYDPNPVALTTLCRQFVDEVEAATERRCPIHLKTDDLTDTGLGDPKLLRHVLTNLLGNAVKYSAAGRDVEFIVTRENSSAVFSVKDQGAGIPEQDQKRLFTAFYRGSNVEHIRGTGLGLLIARRCVERMSGSIDLQSIEGVGTTVTVRLPMFGPHAE